MRLRLIQKRYRPAALAVTVILSTLTVLSGLPSVIRDSLCYTNEGEVKIGCERKGVTLMLMRLKPGGINRTLHIDQRLDRTEVIATNSVSLVQYKTIGSVRDLKGLVTITTPADALRFVRFATSVDMGGLWDAGRPRTKMFEVRSYEDYLREPDYGVLGRSRFGLNATGYCGLVPSATLNSTRFPPALVVADGNQFRITRWLVVFDFEPGMENNPLYKPNASGLLYVRETVTQDGGYSRVILKTASPSIAQGVIWTMDDTIFVDD